MLFGHILTSLRRKAYTGILRDHCQRTPPSEQKQQQTEHAPDCLAAYIGPQNLSPKPNPKTLKPYTTKRLTPPCENIHKPLNVNPRRINNGYGQEASSVRCLVALCSSWVVWSFRGLQSISCMRFRHAHSLTQARQGLGSFRVLEGIYMRFRVSALTTATNLAQSLVDLGVRGVWVRDTACGSNWLSTLAQKRLTFSII